MGAAAALAFGVVPIFVKQAYAHGADELALLAARFAVTALVVGAYAVARRKALRGGPRSIAALALLGALGYAFESALYFMALRRSPAGVVGLVFYSYPLWTTLLAAGLGLDRVRARNWVALGLGSAGVALVFTLPDGGLAGPSLALASALAVAVYLTVAQVVLEGVDPAAAATWTAAGAALALAVVSGAVGQRVPLEALPHAAVIGIATGLAFLGLYGAIARIGSARSSVATMLEPVTTVALASLFLHEDVTARVIVGGLLVVSALPVLVGRGSG
jgi:drug/metabolite transporter (DMT)-like permease